MVCAQLVQIETRTRSVLAMRFRTGGRRAHTQVCLWRLLFAAVNGLGGASEVVMAHATRWLGTWCLALAALAACSGDDDALPSEPPVEPRETTTTTTAVVATSAVQATEPPAATSLPDAPSTSAPETTAVPSDPDIEAALAAVDGFYVRWRECLRDLPACDPTSFSEIADPVAAANMAEQINRRQEEHQWAENVDSYTYTPTGVERVEGRIVVTVCQRDAIVITRRPPGEPEVPVFDGFISKFREWHVDPTEAGWRIVSTTTVQEATGIENDLCA